MIEKLEAVSRGDVSRLIVAMPPGAAKSTYASVLFPAHFLANHPTASVIAASHTTELAEKWGRRVRDLIVEHGPTLGISLSSDTAAVGRWQLVSGGGEYLAVGAGSAVLGYRADLCVIDDPVRSREAAMSEANRELLWNWFMTDIRSRMKPGGRIVIISTRFHELDLVGKLLEEQHKSDAEKWDTLILPAVAEENDPLGREVGAYLWDDDNYGYANVLRRERHVQPPWNWASLFQQRAAPLVGDLVLREWLKPYEKYPPIDMLRVFMGTDFSVAGKDTSDHTAFVVVGIASDRSLWLLDVFRKRCTPDVSVEQLFRMVKRWKPIFVAEEQGVIRHSLDPLIKRFQQDFKLVIPRKAFTPKVDKVLRFQGFRGHIAMYGLHVPMKAAWWPEVQQEILRFPVGSSDDVIDALSMVGQMLDIMVPPNNAAKIIELRQPPKDYVPFDNRDADWSPGSSIKLL